MEEVDREQPFGLGAQESAPRVAVFGRRVDPMSAQDPTQSGRRDPVAEAAQFARIRTTPQVEFSAASRRTNFTMSSGVGGRPGGLGWRHVVATSRRCQRSSVAGVTIRWARRALGTSLARAASTALSIQCSRGLGLDRRSTATS